MATVIIFAGLQYVHSENPSQPFRTSSVEDPIMAVTYRMQLRTAKRETEVIVTPHERPATFGIHLNYEEPSSSWDLDAIIDEVRRANPGIIVIYGGTSGESMEKLYALAVRLEMDAGVSMIVIRVHAKLTQEVWDFFAQQISEGYTYDLDSMDPLVPVVEMVSKWRGYGPSPVKDRRAIWDWFPGAWMFGKTKLPPHCVREREYVRRLSGNPDLTFAEFAALRGWAIQMYNEPDLRVEWQDVNGPPWSGEVWDNRYTDLLGYIVCAAIGGWITAAYEADFPTILDEEYYNRFDIRRPRVVIPDVSGASRGSRGSYIAGCTKAWLGFRAERTGYGEGFYRALTRGIEFIYGLHSYPPCDNYERAIQYTLEDISSVMSAPLTWRSTGTVGMTTPFEVVVTEWGCAYNPAYPATREDQRRVMRLLLQRTNVPVAWWVGVGRNCGFGNTAHNTPSHWDNVALWDKEGHVCVDEAQK